MLTMSPLPRPQERVLHGILEVFRGYTCVQMGTHDVTHLRGDKRVGILQGWKEAGAFMLRILRMVVFERIPAAFDRRTGCPFGDTPRAKISRGLGALQLDALIMFWARATRRALRL
jgi:hypothetical protein